MAGKFTALSKLLGTTAAAATASAPAPKAGAEGGDTLELTEDTEVVLASEVLPAIAAAKAEGHAAGVKAERERTATVLASDPAKANMGAAAFMLSESDASAETIVAKLPSLGTSAPAPKANEGDGGQPAKPLLSVDLSETPKTDAGKPAGAANDGGGDALDTDAMWKETQARNANAFSRPAVAEGGAVAYASGG